MQFDLFIVFRYMLCVVVTVYATVRTVQWAWHWVSWLFEPDRHRRVLRRYVTTQLLRVRLRRFGWDLAQIAVLTVILCEMIRRHQ